MRDSYMKRHTKISLFIGSFLLLIPILYLLISVYLFFSTPINYATEIETVRKQKKFNVSQDVIEIPLGKYLLIRQKNRNQKLYLFKIKDFTKNNDGVMYEGVLLIKNGNKKYEVIEKTQGVMLFNRFITRGKNIFKGLHITILPVNSIIKNHAYVYACYNKHDIVINEGKNVILPKEIPFAGGGND